MNEDIVIPVSLFAFIFAIIYFYLITRNKERMALIEKGSDPLLFKSKYRMALGNFSVLKAGLFFVGIGVGVIMGNILMIYTSLNEGTSYVSMIFLFGGLGLIAGYWFQAKTEKEQTETP